MKFLSLLSCVAGLLLSVDQASAQQTYSNHDTFRLAISTRAVIDFDREPDGTPIPSGTILDTQYSPLGVTLSPFNGGVPRSNGSVPTCTTSASNVMHTKTGSAGGGGFQVDWNLPTHAVGFYLCDLQTQGTFGPTIIELRGIGGAVFAQYTIQDTSGTCSACLVFFGVTSATPIASMSVAIGASDYVLFEDLMYGDAVTGQPFCFCDGSGTQAPCSNEGTAATGCSNSAYSPGGNLSAIGVPSASSPSVVLRGTQAAPGTMGVFFQGESTLQGGNGIPFGDGLRCVGGPIVRLQLTASDGLGSAVTTIDLAAKGGVQQGDTKHYQYWYRDPQNGPCGSGFNLSNGLAVVWAP